MITRREILRNSAALAGTAALYPAMRLAAQDTEVANPISPSMIRLSTYMSEARTRTLPAEVMEKARHHIMDTFAAIISGSELPPGRAALKFAGEYKGGNAATVVASTALAD